MGNKQSYDLTQAQARNNENRLPEEVVSQQDEFCRPVSMASTSSMRKPIKARTKRAKDIDKENVSLASSREDSISPIEEHSDGQREVPIDVPKEPSQPPSIFRSSIREEEDNKMLTESILTEPLAEINQNNSHLYDKPPVEEEILVRAYELPKMELSGGNVTTEEVKVDYKTEKERAKHVAEEAVKQVEKRNSQDRSHSTTSTDQSNTFTAIQSADLEPLHKAMEIVNIPLKQGGSQRIEQAEIDEATKQLDDAITEVYTTQEDSVVVLEESAVEEFATVSLALDEDISAIEISHTRRELQKLHYTQPLGAHPLDALPSQSHYIKLK